MAAVEAATGRVDASRVRPYSEVAKGYTRFSEGDVLFAKITPCMENGKIAVARGLTNGAGYGSTEFHVLRPLGHVSGELVMYYLLQDDFRREARRHMAGTAGQLRVPAWFVSEAPFPLPPLTEQHRIVAEIDDHLTRLDAAVASLQRARANLKRYRASVLKAACEGRLVPTEAELARREGRDYEPASALLERILRERRERWEAQPRRPGAYREPQSPDTDNLPPLPEGWAWASIDQCFDVYVGATPRRARPEYWGGDIPWVSSGEVAFVRIGQTRETITDEGFKRTNLDLHPPGTILLGMIGEGKTRGQVAILDIEACNNQNSAAIRVSETEVIPEYVYDFLWSEYESVRRRGSGGNQPALNRSRVQGIVFPLPPLAEQRRIVAEVERHLSVIQAAESAVEANLKRAERLRQAILRRAFEGKLVPQDPTDEPASVLLERIRAEREQADRNAPQPRRRIGRRRKAHEVSA
jgi:type I restriction enzyme S subunit